MTPKTYTVVFPSGATISSVSAADYEALKQKSQQAFDALRLAVLLINDLMPGARYVHGLDIGKLNDGLLEIGRTLGD